MNVRERKARLKTTQKQQQQQQKQKTSKSTGHWLAILRNGYDLLPILNFENFPK